MVRTNELFGVLIAALLLLIGPMRPAAAATEDVPLDQIDQEFGKPNPNAPAALQAQRGILPLAEFERVLLAQANKKEAAERRSF